MHRFNSYIILRRNFFINYLMFQDKDEKSFEKRIRMFYLLNRRFQEALDLLPKREKALFLQHINNPNLGNPFYNPVFIGEKNQTYARLLVNRAAAVVEDYLRRFDLEISVPHISLKPTLVINEEEDEECIAGENFFPIDPLLPYKEKARLLNIDPQVLYDIDHLEKQEPEASGLNEKELYQRIKKKCEENDLPEELAFYMLTTVAEYLKAGTVSPILLVGKPGIGKTHFGRVFADIIGLHYYKISAPGASAGRGLTGDSPTYRAARFGEIVNAQLEARATNPVILIDEIDKSLTGSAHHPLSDELLSCLDGTRTVKDHFLEMEISTAQIPFILTANVARNIPAWLKDRCLVIEFPDPSAERIASIISKRFDTLRRNPLYEGRIRVDRDALMQTIAAMRAKKIVSLRQYSTVLENAAKAAYLEMLEKNRNSVTISDRHFEQVMKLLGNAPAERHIGFRTE